jgi:hypothetical protein
MPTPKTPDRWHPHGCLPPVEMVLPSRTQTRRPVPRHGIGRVPAFYRAVTSEAYCLVVPNLSQSDGAFRECLDRSRTRTSPSQIPSRPAGYLEYHKTGKPGVSVSCQTVSGADRSCGRTWSSGTGTSASSLSFISRTVRQQPRPLVVICEYIHIIVGEDNVVKREGRVSSKDR